MDSSSWTIDSGSRAARSGDWTACGKYRLRGAVTHAPRDATFVMHGSQALKVSQDGLLVLLENERGSYFEFDHPRGPVFASSENGAFYPDPAPEAHAIMSLESTLSWLDLTDAPSRTRGDEHLRRACLVHTNIQSWGDGEIWSDGETGLIVRIDLRSMRGAIDFTCTSLDVTRPGDVTELQWTGPTRPMPPVRSLKL